MIFHHFPAFLFLVLNNILLCACNTISLHLPVEGQLGHFEVLVIINKATYKPSCVEFCVHLNVQLIWINASEDNSLVAQ